MRLIFVYNAEAGLVNGMLDSVHKLVSPATYDCSLCAITYGAFAMNRGWRDYIQGLPFETAFYHRKDFAAAFPNAQAALPAIFYEEAGFLTPLITAPEMKALKTVDALVAALNAALQERALH